jgi:hypothetical protein
MGDISVEGESERVDRGFEQPGRWYLMREDLEIDGVSYGAGTPVRRTSSGWFVEGHDRPLTASLEKSVCRTEYAGLSLHVISHSTDGTLSQRRLGGSDESEVLPCSRVLSPPEPGTSRVYLAFGDQFYPLEYFGW